ncbi:MAG: hypothetical protein EPN25_02475 [Nitrospirae bacterium]|nr:MAG: hypothetical protein EPN25_02475 [Nitrospirota bacterium]
MAYNPEYHHRRSIRLKGYDYSRPGAYFVTVCAWKKESMFGEVANGEMLLNECGQNVVHCWNDLPCHYPNGQLDEFIVMPNHIHGIIMLNVGAGLQPARIEAGTNVGAGFKPARIDTDSDEINRAGLKPAPTKCHGLPEIVRAFKTFSARRVNTLRNTPGVPLWQRNYHEHIIRDDRELHAIREYIRYNPLRWGEDDENPNRHM